MSHINFNDDEASSSVFVRFHRQLYRVAKNRNANTHMASDAYEMSEHISN